MFRLDKETLSKFTVGKDMSGNMVLKFEGKIAAFTTNHDTKKEHTEALVKAILDNIPGGEDCLYFNWMLADNSDLPTFWYTSGALCVPDSDYLELSELYYRWSIEMIRGDMNEIWVCRGDYSGNLCVASFTEDAVLLDLLDFDDTPEIIVE